MAHPRRSPRNSGIHFVCEVIHNKPIECDRVTSTFDLNPRSHAPATSVLDFLSRAKTFHSATILRQRQYNLNAIIMTDASLSLVTIHCRQAAINTSIGLDINNRTAEVQSGAYRPVNR